MDACEHKGIPLLVFSAGLYDVIKEILVDSNMLTSNVHIISNRMNFDEETGVVQSLQDPLIHVFNKNEACISSKSYHEQIESRKNVIVMGDSIGDLRMSEGLAHATELTVGFLNHDVESLTESYVNAFDIVIMNDSSLQPVNDLLDLLQW